MKYSENEIENLKRLLIDADLTNVVLGMEMLGTDEGLIEACFLELYVLYWFNRGGMDFAEKVADKLLLFDYKMERMLAMGDRFKLFQHTRKDTVPQLYLEFEEEGADIREIFKASDFYLERIKNAGDALQYDACYKEAAALFKLNVDLYPTKAAVYCDYGSFLLHSFDELQEEESKESISGKLIQSFEKSFELDPNNFYWFFDLAMHYHYQIKDYAKAEKLYLEVIKHEPQNHSARHMLGVLHHLNIDVEKGKYWYQETLKIFPLRINTLNNLAWLLATEENDFEAALPLAEKAVKLDDESAENLNTKAFVLWKGFNQAELAEELYLKAHELHKEQVAKNEEGKKMNKYEWGYGGLQSAGGSDTCVRLADLAIELHADYLSAKTWLKRGIKLNPDDKIPLEKLGDLMLEIFEDKKSAIYYYRKLLKLDSGNKILENRVKELVKKK